ncbi:S-adenosyl-L-methionine-dependent methyltransferase [Terfezia boudieri ATCC MYA-4762]|uniref:type I protein arginine methyltransferase n=1 Tax=Terfezia boudieri ATCC MYA-4762 TaxID=1051890 RepID=A0A3N4LQ38_9PEZI|nr:S-adenosyl-L-methionine-dependent methyltransferase [Terfezia boudieri ATCC MYA-4762]
MVSDYSDIDHNGDQIVSDEEGWESAEDDMGNDETPSQCLFCTLVCPSTKKVLDHCRQHHSFDLKTVREKLDLDFYYTIKLINYIRHRIITSHDAAPEVIRDIELGTARPALSEDKYLQPVLEDDPLLFSFEDEDDDDDDLKLSADKRVNFLEEQLDKLKSEFAEYQEMVRRNFAETLKERIESTSEEGPSKSQEKAVATDGIKEVAKKDRDDDSHYFTSYAGNDIHETMLKDTVRTEGYRDFIYGNKHLFKDKVVLDVGCGTGILSMFCAKAGAKKVIGVDNSDIIDKARANVFENKLDGIITLIRGKIEEVTLPVKKVDIIVSEWMGYCLLYEAMLDSVLHARDKYLEPITGIMVPSHINLAISTLSDSELINDRVNFWNEVYGFKMTAMKEKIDEDVVVTGLGMRSLSSTPVTFCHLPLGTVTVEDLSFIRPFELIVDGGGDGTKKGEEGTEEEGWQELDRLDGFVIYFDTFFLPHPPPYSASAISSSSRSETWEYYDHKTGGRGVTFTTGPYRTVTHWQQGVLLINQDNLLEEVVKKGDKVMGKVEYRKSESNSRELKIGMSWTLQRGNGAIECERKQLWHMR